MLQALISPMKFALVKAAIRQLLVTERDNQKSLAPEAGKTAAEIANAYDFTVVQDVFCTPEIGSMPLVNLYNVKGLFDGQGQDYSDGQWETYHLAVDCYAASTAESGSPFYPDQLAANRLDYLWAQVYKTLGAEENYYKGLSSIVKSSRWVKWEQKYVSKTDSAETILVIQAVLELQFNEPTERLTGEQWEELVINLGLNGTEIAPFLTVDMTT